MPVVVWSGDGQVAERAKVSAKTFNSCAWEGVARGEVFRCARRERRWACDAGKVPAADDDGAVGKYGGVPAVGENRSQRKIAPSEPSETRIGSPGCHVRAV